MRFNGRSDPSSITSKSLSSLPPLKTKKKNNHLHIDVPDKKLQSSNINIPRRKSTSENGKINKCPIIPRTAKFAEISFDVDFDKKFNEERLCNENECMWLSSDCSSPSSFFDQYTSPESYHLVDEWLGNAFLASQVKDTEEEEEEDHEAETWLFSPLENEAALSTSCDIDSLDEVTFMLSLVDLDEENVVRSETPVLGFVSEFDCRDEEPLFWPFKSKFNREVEESMKYFSMSPRKNNLLDRSKTLDLRSGCRRRLEFSDGILTSLKGNNSSPKENLVEESRLDTGKNNNLWRNSTMPSRLSTTKSRTLQDLLILEDADMLTVYGEDEEDYPIEKLMGLDEFDGHEGVGSDFNRDSFSLDGSFRML